MTLLIIKKAVFWGVDIVHSGRSVLNLQRRLLPPSSGFRGSRFLRNVVTLCETTWYCVAEDIFVVTAIRNSNLTRMTAVMTCAYDMTRPPFHSSFFILSS